MFVVIENTPGYLPDSDDRTAFETPAEAVRYLCTEVEKYIDDIEEAGGVATAKWSRDLTQCTVYRDDRTHDLGRAFEVVNDLEEANG